MREVNASIVAGHMPQLMSDVDKGETILITRDGRTVARIIPEPAALSDGTVEDAAARTERMLKLKAKIEAARINRPGLTLDEILSFRHEGHKY